MRRKSKSPVPTPEVASSPPSDQREPSPLSLGKLREAFAVMLGSTEGQQDTRNATGEPASTAAGENAPVTDLPESPPELCEINPRSVVEAMLFVGRPDNRPVSSRELAAAMRGVSPTEVDSAVSELNELYDADSAPYRIDHTPAGYRLVLRDEFARMRDKFYGRVREARLSTAAMEVLSIVAYSQPISAAEIDTLRGAASGAPLATLVRRRLLRLDRSADHGAAGCYRTTDRFLRLFGLENLSFLPRSEELEKI
jgi:segregation and condensation protein B